MKREVSEGNLNTAAALQQLRLKLLDLTGRNRLINFKHSLGKSIQFVEGNPAAIFHRLVEVGGKASIDIVGLKDPSRIDWIEANGRMQKPDPKDWAFATGVSTSFDLPRDTVISEHTNLRALMYSDELAKHCRKIERDALLSIEESGTNTLYLVLGFLEFPDQRDSDKIFAAPLISLPVTLQKNDAGGIQHFSLQCAGDEISENLSLRLKLKNDFGLILPELSEEKINLLEYFSEIEKIIANQPRFDLKYRASLCLMSFGGMLLVRDLDPDQWPQSDSKNGLLDHHIVSEIFKGRLNDENTASDHSDEHLVEEGPGAAIPLVYDADSSQHSALIDVLLHKKNLVIEGPPGTGKSQTITNLIAACLARGKTVLFVAEKLAALQVVKDRLSLAGLNPFLLELHSNKSNKKQVLEDISSRVELRSDRSPELPRLLKQQEEHRLQLKAYSDLINSVPQDSFGLTLHQVIWRAEKHRQKLSCDEKVISQLRCSGTAQLSEFQFQRQLDCLGYLASQFALIDGFEPGSPFWGFYPENIFPGDEIKIGQQLEEANAWTVNWVDSIKNLSSTLRCRIRNFLSLFTNKNVLLLNDLMVSIDLDLPLHLVPRFCRYGVTTEKASLVINEFADKLEKMRRLEIDVKAFLKNRSEVFFSDLDGLKKFQRASQDLGANLGNQAEVQEMHLKILENTNRLSSSHAKLKLFFSSKNIPYDGSLQCLVHILDFVRLIDDAPLNLFHLITPQIGQDGAVQAIENLTSMLTNIADIENGLIEILYIDLLPKEEEIKSAILTLRQGGAWYRIFDREWRKAVNLHKNLQRSKQRISWENRLNQLEKVLKLVDLKGQWNSSPTWRIFFGAEIPIAEISLDSQLVLAKWIRDLKHASDRIQFGKGEPFNKSSDQFTLMRVDFFTIKNDLLIAINAFQQIRNTFVLIKEAEEGSLTESVLSICRRFSESLEGHLGSFKLASRDEATFDQFIGGLESSKEISILSSQIHSDAELKKLLGDAFFGLETDITKIKRVFSVVQNIQKLDLAPELKDALCAGHPLEVCKSLISESEKVLFWFHKFESFVLFFKKFGEFNPEAWTQKLVADDLEEFAVALHVIILKAVGKRDLIIPWSQYIQRRKETTELSLVQFAQNLENRQIKPEELTDAFAYCSFSAVVREAFANIPQLARFTGIKHHQIREEFKRLDKEIISLRGKAIAADCVKQSLPPMGNSGSRVDDRTEMYLLNHLMPQQRPRMPVRKILSRAGKAIQALKPCFMMGPQAVAQYLTPGICKFDLVIMDEASQLKPEQAIGAIARGGQLVVVGDPKQLPPTEFFSRGSQEGDTAEDYFTTSDAESILDVCSSQYRPTRSLRWHYRSQHHSLIAFSNHTFYRGNLVIFPSPYGQGGSLGVRAVYLADSVYENQTNMSEASRVVDAALEHIRTRPKESLGIATLNVKQRDLIFEMLDERLRTARDADEYQDHWRSEGQPIFVKNLENIQGDERDAIIISTTFGKSLGSNSVRQNFGPISKQGGWRRLNVLFTRAKRSVLVVTSLRPEDIVLDSTTPEGTRALRQYLQYIQSGNLATAHETNYEPDSDFEISVAEMLQRNSYDVTPQLGVAGFRIDIAVKHPSIPGVYLSAIECDGATYHSALSVRDRDRIRQEIIESLGWRGRIWRIWSTDWFRSPQQEADKLLNFLNGLRENWKPDHFSGDSWIEESAPKSDLSSKTNQLAQVRQSPPKTKFVPESRDLHLEDTEDNLEIQVGDVVRYVDLSKPNDVVSVQISSGTDDRAHGVVNEARPLAQALLGAVVDDEVRLHLVGCPSRIFKIVGIKRGVINTTDADPAPEKRKILKTA